MSSYIRSKYRKLVSVALLTSGAFAVLASRVEAVNLYPPAGLKIKNLGDLVTYGVPVIYAATALLFFGMLIYGGYKFLISQGKPDDISAAVNILKAAIMGLVIVLAARIITTMIGKLIGVQIF